MFLNREIYGTDNHHSLLLNKYFILNKQGLDYINPNLVIIEFKESFSKKRNRIAIYEKDILANYLGINIRHKLFYVIKTNLLQLLDFNNKYRVKHIESNILITQNIFKTNSITQFKRFIDFLK